ncbi:MAG: thermonuclease family protein [Thermodesulfobacteriota bacterium]
MKLGKDPVIVLVFIALAAAYYLYTTYYAENEGSRETFLVSDVIDGDTIAIGDGRGTLVRYIGIDTPEIARQDSPGDPYSGEALEFNRKLVEGKSVTLEYDNERYDVYGRLLAYVFSNGVLVNEELLRSGLATPLFIEPNVKYRERFERAAEEAKKEKKGMWGGLDTIEVPEGNGGFVIEIESAPRYEGKRVVVRGEITRTRKSDSAVVLSIDGKLDVVIFPDDLGNFEFFGIDPASYYKGMEVEVTGRIKMHKGTPGIIVNHPMLIRRTG